MNFEETYKNNLEFIQKGWASIYDEILNSDISQYEIILENDQVNVSVNGHLLYPKNVNESITQQVDAFVKEPTSYFKKPAFSGVHEGYVHDYLIKDVEKISPYLKDPNPFTDYHHNMDDFIPMLLLMGIGSGKHLELLLQKTDIKEAYIVDQDYSLLKVSLHLMDWRPIFTHFKQENYSLKFAINEKPEAMAHVFLNDVYRYKAYQFFNVPYYTHYESKYFTKFKQEILNKIELSFSGLGFYDDELMSLNHTIQNIKNKRPILKNIKKLPKHSTAFIIASGPSIDNDIEEIKKHQGKAVIFTCGTALRVLYEHGITPDFHVESERTSIVTPLLKENMPADYLKSINIIGLNVIYPAVYELFKSAKIFFRENDAGSSIVTDDIPKLNHCNPTATNATLSLVSELHFDNIYLFGADMGFRDVKKHHSKSSAYYDDKSDILERTRFRVQEKKYPGNFNRDEEFLSTDIYLWCKQRAENCIKESLEKKKSLINYFNCSDGLKIDLATPINSNKLAINKDLNKEKVLEAIGNSFDTDFKNLSKKITKKFKEEKALLFKNIDSIQNIIKSTKITTMKDFFIVLDKIYILAAHPENVNKAYLTRAILKGTTYHISVTIFTHSLANLDKNESIEFINSSLNRYLVFLDHVNKTLNDINFD